MDSKVNLDNWNRTEIFEFYGGVSNPLYCVSFRQNVTNVYNYTKSHQTSFYFTLIYLCTKALNSINQFLYSIRENDVYKIDIRSPSVTNKRNDKDYFQIVNLNYCNDMSLEEFNSNAQIKCETQDCFINFKEESDKMIYFSCLPWIDVTGLTNESDILSKNHNCDSIPRIAWGKYIINGDIVELGMSIEINHRLIDGYHIGLFVNKLNELIEELN